ncbi:MAG TPA: hypothetical protein VJH95_01150 [Candidatus Nanoarchaeia archaeon]|nr:hypothetical protein [Candidatus Nanoarchaeia archaeon]
MVQDELRETLESIPPLFYYFENPDPDSDELLTGPKEAAPGQLESFLKGKPDTPNWRAYFKMQRTHPLWEPISYNGLIYPLGGILDYYRLKGRGIKVTTPHELPSLKDTLKFFNSLPPSQQHYLQEDYS